MSLNTILREREIPLDSLRIITLLIVFFWIILQLYFIGLYAGLPQYSDAGEYYRLAQECYNNNSWYPMKNHIDDEPFIFNPGFVNFLILQLNILGTLKFFPVVNMGLNFILLYCLKTITAKLINEKASLCYVILFCLLPSNSTCVIATLTELLTTTLIFSALLLCRKSYWSLFLSTLLLVYAHYIRPSSLLFVPSILLFFYYKKYEIKKILFFLVSFVISYMVLLSLVQFTTHADKLEGTTGGYNLIMVANDDANGDFLPKVFEKGEYGYIEDHQFNVYEKDSIWREKGLIWIKENPIKFLSFAPHKLLGLWKTDTDFPEIFDKQNTSFKHSDFYLFVLKKLCRHFAYYFILTLAILGMWKIRKRLLGYYGIFLIPLILNCIMIMIIYGYARYHFIFMPIVLLYATFVFSNPTLSKREE